MPPILLAVFHCSLYRERISSWGAAGLFQFPLLREGRRGKSCTTSSFLRFQFTLLREGRLDDVMNALKPILFQFTPLREGRHVSDEGVRVHFYFNSRPSARGDSCTSISSVLFTISIHAPPRGATQLIGIGCGSSIFQFTPLREGRLPIRPVHPRVRGYFNSRPSARGDPIPAHGDSTFPFQFTPLREGRPTAYAHGWQRNLFQFTPLREGRPRLSARMVDQ